MLNNRSIAALEMGQSGMIGLLYFCASEKCSVQGYKVGNANNRKANVVQDDPSRNVLFKFINIVLCIDIGIVLLTLPCFRNDSLVDWHHDDKCPRKRK